MDIDYVEDANVYHDADGVEHGPHDRVLVRLSSDPVPHYNRGRTFIEPRSDT